MIVFSDMAREVRLTPGSQWTWLCSISPLLHCATALLAALLIMCGLGNSVFMLTPLIAGLFFSLFAMSAVPVWCILVFSQKFRLAWRTHRVQACIFILSWIVMLLVGWSLKPLPLPKWLD